MSSQLFTQMIEMGAQDLALDEIVQMGMGLGEFMLANPNRRPKEFGSAWAC